MRRISLAAALLLAAACGQTTTPGTTAPGGFVSADVPSTSGMGMVPGTAEDGAGGKADAGTTVEEGDIFRLLPGGTLADLNAYRGLVTLDVSNPASPRLLGRAALSGWPVEMVVAGSHAYALVNGWQSYYGGRGDVKVQGYAGGMVVAIDISDPAHPAVSQTLQIPGWIDTSRLVRTGDQAALYVVAYDWNAGSGALAGSPTGHAVVRSFAIAADGTLAPAGQADLGGYVQAAQATPEGLIVAHENGTWDRSQVAVFAIDAQGRLDAGPDVAVAGRVWEKTHLDLRGGILRVVSSAPEAVHLQTFRVDGASATAVDDASFGDGQQLYASIFLEDRGFFVTYKRVDPFHAFSIAADGHVVPHATFVVSGWNDFFKVAFDGTRLLGIGVDDQASWSLTASLWAIDDLDSQQPLLARASADGRYGWSEARWDDRAFTVLEDAVDVVSPGGQRETGLILLPYSGYDPDKNTYGSGVQLFSFSEATLTRRGLLATDVPSRRALLTAPAVAGALSDVDLTLADLSNPDAPARLSRIDVAPSFTDFFVAGGRGARVRDPLDYWGYWGGGAPDVKAQVEVVPLGGDPTEARPDTSFDIPAGGNVSQVGSLLVSVDTRYVDGSQDPPRYTSAVDVIDMSGQPSRKGHLDTEAIPPSWNRYWLFGGIDCLGCRGYGGGYSDARAVGQALVFPSWEYEQKYLRTDHVCSIWPTSYGQICDDAGRCRSVQGGVTCRGSGADRVCSGSIQICVQDANKKVTCVEANPGEVATTESCWDEPVYRSWRHLTLQILDLRDPSAPVMRQPVVLPAEEDDDSILSDGSDLLVSFRVPFERPGDPRSWVRWYVRRIGLADPARPFLGSPVNVPGAAVAAWDDRIVTRDAAWSSDFAETSIALVSVKNGGAQLLARHDYPGDWVGDVRLDGAGHVLASHRQQQGVVDWSTVQQKLSVLEAANLRERADVDVDTWATLQGATAGRALFSVPGGMLVMNLDNASAPWAQAYFPTLGWPERITVTGRDAYFAAGRYGVYRFDLDEVNLTPGP